MLKVDGPGPSSPDLSLPAANLSALSRNASVISTSSSDSSPSPLLNTPRPRPARTFSAPRSLSPHSRTPLISQTPSYLAHELGMPETPTGSPSNRSSKSRSKSRTRNAGVSVEDFKFGPLLGEGSYSTVKVATHIRTGQQYAIKVLEKSHLIKKDKMLTALAEKNALVRLGAGHPGIVRLYYAFQDEWRLYFVIDLARNGEMQSLISRLGSLSVDCARYYAAQVIDAIDYMHSKDVIHRDLKPENLLLDDNYRIKITDFGTGKILESGDRAETWVGTAQYVAPELLEAKETSKSSDFWALGCIIYQMIAGRFAFQGLSEYLTWQKIKQLDYTFPDGFDPEAQDLIKRLLVRKPEDRLGVGRSGTANDMKALRSHPFFSSINWNTLWTDPHPPLEPGLYKKEPRLGNNAEHNWKDIGAEWDDLVSAEGSDDGLAWASDADSPYPKVRHSTPDGTGQGLGQQDSNYSGDMAHNLTRQRTESTARHPVEQLRDVTAHPEVEPERTEEPLQASRSSSSNGSTADRLAQLPKRVDVSTERSLSAPANRNGEPEETRGRTKAMSPVQGNGFPSEFDFASALHLPAGEEVLFASPVEARSLRRRASRLLPLPVPPGRPKTRALVLTSKRLFCLKPIKGADVTIKSELILRVPEKSKDKDKEKETRGAISAIERKGEREFVVIATSKTLSYAASTAQLADAWLEKINSAIASYGR